MLNSSVTSADWNAAKYSTKGVPPCEGKELPLEASYFIHAAAGLTGLIETTFFAITKSAKFSVGDYSINGCTIPQSFETPFGDKVYPPYDPNCVKNKEGGLDFDFSPDITKFFVKIGYMSIPFVGSGDVYLGFGFIVNIGLGSKSITAQWQAEGNASGSGNIEYLAPPPLGEITFGPVKAGGLDSAQPASIRLNEWVYHPSLLLRLFSYICFKVVETDANGKETTRISCSNFSTKNWPIKIYEQVIKADADLSVHKRTSDSIERIRQLFLSAIRSPSPPK
jgi:hypothetical protein